MPPEPPPLHKVLRLLWDGLAEAVGEPQNPLRTPALGTSDSTGSHTRTVILRGAEQGDRRLIAYTDNRSRKVRQLALNPRASWLFYDPDLRRQIRMEGPAETHTDDRLADDAWAGLSEPGRRLYAGPPPGGPANAEPAPSPRRNFVVLRGTVDCIDWLDLTVPGHRRAIFTWCDAQWRGQWLAP
jgi:hypothetical protein